MANSKTVLKRVREHLEAMLPGMVNGVECGKRMQPGNAVHLGRNIAQGIADRHALIEIILEDIDTVLWP